MSTLQLFNQTITSPSWQGYLEKVLGQKKASFVNNITALVSNSKALQSCEPQSIIFAATKATALDLPLDPNLGFAYVIPYNNRREGKQEAQFQIGYKGFIQLAIRSGQFKTINVTEIREGEVETVNLLTGEVKFNAKPNRHELPVIGYAAFFRLAGGFEKTLYATKEEVEAHAKKYSQTYSNDRTKQSSKWTTDFDAMAKKTVLKLLLSKYAPMSVEMQSAIVSDQAVITEQGNKYVDNEIEDAVAEEIETNANQAEIGMGDGMQAETIQAQVPDPQPAPAQPAGPGF